MDNLPNDVLYIITLKSECERFSTMMDALVLCVIPYLLTEARHPREENGRVVGRLYSGDFVFRTSSFMLTALKRVCSKTYMELKKGHEYWYSNTASFCTDEYMRNQKSSMIIQSVYLRAYQPQYKYG